MNAKSEPKGNRFDLTLDTNRRLKHGTDQEGGHWQFARSVNTNDEILTNVTIGEDNVTGYLDHTYSTVAQASFTQSAYGFTL